MADIKKLKKDLEQKLKKVRKLQKQIPTYVAGAAEKMKDANFSAEGFVESGVANPKWAKRKKETRKTEGKRILHNTGYMQQNVKAKALSDRVKVGIDTTKVPYAKAHNEGGTLSQYVRAHTRIHQRTGKRYQVRSFFRKIRMPKRKFLGYTPDIDKIAKKDIDHQVKKIFK